MLCYEAWIRRGRGLEGLEDEQCTKVDWEGVRLSLVRVGSNFRPSQILQSRNQTLPTLTRFANHFLCLASEQALDSVPLPLVKTEADLLRKRWSSKKVKPVSSVSTEEQLHRRDGGPRWPITHQLMGVSKPCSRKTLYDSVFPSNANSRVGSKGLHTFCYLQLPSTGHHMSPLPSSRCRFHQRAQVEREQCQSR